MFSDALLSLRDLECLRLGTGILILQEDKKEDKKSKIKSLMYLILNSEAIFVKISSPFL
jgi:hypothetical protein